VSLNLRYPTAGETSASLLRIMGAGVPVLVSRTGSFEELPDDAAGKVDVGDIEEELLVEYLLLLARRPDVRAAMSAAARRYVAEQHTLEGAARGYLEFITSLDASRREPARIEVPPVPPAPMPDFSKVRGLAVECEPERQRAELPPDDPLAVIAEAAAEMGVTERDTAALEYIGEAVGPLLGGDGAAGERGR
jgi:hypothetical protein